MKSLAISLKYKQDGNLHIVTADDIPGLLIASENLEAVILDVPVAAKRLIEVNLGIVAESVDWLWKFSSNPHNLARTAEASDLVHARLLVQVNT